MKLWSNTEIIKYSLSPKDQRTGYNFVICQSIYLSLYELSEPIWKYIFSRTSVDAIFFFVVWKNLSIFMSALIFSECIEIKITSNAKFPRNRVSNKNIHLINLRTKTIEKKSVCTVSVPIFVCVHSFIREYFSRDWNWVFFSRQIIVLMG